MPDPLRVVLAGASGLIGSALARSLRSDGHTVTQLVRREPSAPDEARWDPAAGRLDSAVLRGADVAVCLSGAGVGDRRWTERYKRTLLSSRLDTVGLMARTLAETDDGPRVFLSASAVGYYGDTGDQIVDESAPPGSGFLADLSVQWEAAAKPAADAGVRVAILRTGLPLTSDGGLLARLRPIVRFGIGGRLGSGEQFMSPISLADEIAAIRFLMSADLSGPVNLTGPDAVRNKEFISELASLLHRPAVLPAPAFALRAVLGEIAGDALTGQRAIPAKLTAAGFTFQHPDLASALSWALGH